MTNARRADARRVAHPAPRAGGLAYAEEKSGSYDLCMDLRGTTPCCSGRLPHGAPRRGRQNTAWAFLRVRSKAIAGGTSEVQRNILGERVLGLPGDVRTDKELPWKDVPRS